MSSQDSSKVCSQTTIEVLPFEILEASPVDETQKDQGLKDLTKIISDQQPA